MENVKVSRVFVEPVSCHPRTKKKITAGKHGDQKSGANNLKQNLGMSHLLRETPLQRHEQFAQHSDDRLDL